MKYMRYLEKLNLICNYSNQFIYLYLKLLFFSIISLNFLLGGCEKEDENKAQQKQISRLEKEAEKNIISKVKTQNNYFLKHKSFFKPPDEQATKYGSFPPIFGTQKCYRYYTQTDTKVFSQTSIDAVYSYAVQDDCGGMFGFEIRSYVGAVFAVCMNGYKQLKMISIVCRNKESYELPSQPEYINSVVKCPANTIQVLPI
ncbi:Lipoprotein [Nostoc sp. DSM 114167]